MLESGDGIERSGSTGGHSAHRPGRACGNRPRLEQYLESELDGAAALEQAHRVVQVDVVARREHDRGLWVVPSPLERLVPPLLDSISLGDANN